MSLEREPTRRSGRRRSRRRRTGQIINSNHSDGDGTTWNHPVPRPILVSVSVLLPLLLGTASCSSISPDIRHHRRRRRQQGISIGSGTSLTTCTQNLLQADSNPRDESISQIEFVSFVASTLLDASDDPSCGDPAGSGGCVLYLDSDGTTLWNGSYQTPVTSFGLLPPDLVGLFNRFACGNANYGCLNGIDVSGAAREENGEGTLTDQEQAVLFRFCAGVEEAAEELGGAPGARRWWVPPRRRPPFPRVRRKATSPTRPTRPETSSSALWTRTTRKPLLPVSIIAVATFPTRRGVRRKCTLPERVRIGIWRGL